MKPFGVHTPQHGVRPRVAIVVLAAIVGVGSLVAGIYLGVNDLIERRRETVPPTTEAVTTTVTIPPEPVTTVVTDPTETMVVTDDTGALTITVPVAWSDVDGSAWDSEGVPVGIQVAAAPDLEAWRTEWGTPGVFVGVTDVFSLEQAYGEWGDSCVGREPDFGFVAGDVVGTVQEWSGCGPESSTFLVGAGGAGGALVLVFQAVVVSDADRVAAETSLATLSYQP